MFRKTFIIFFSLLIVLLTSCNSFEERKAEKYIKKYYNSLMKENYEKAFETLYLYDDIYFEGKTSLSTNDAKNIYLKKTKHLDKVDYRLLDFEILEVEYEDGHSFWHHVLITGEYDGGKVFEWNEVVVLQEGKLTVSSDDPYINYRNGKMNVRLK